MSNKSINVYSEYGKLKTVLTHRPGEELNNLDPSHLERLLFDDTPDLEVAIKEHDFFTKLMKSKGIEVLFIEQLTADTIKGKKELRNELVNQFVKESGVEKSKEKLLLDYLEKLNDLDLVKKMIAGITKFEIGIKDINNYPLFIDPLPNILFQRDPYASLGNGGSVHKMKTVTRNRETLFIDFVLKHHSRFKDNVTLFYERTATETIEGGDILVLNKKSLIVGGSERTSIKAIETLAKNIFEKGNTSFEKVIALDIKTKNRAFMHLDTVFTNIAPEKFIAHPLIFSQQSEFKIFEITKTGKKEIKLKLEDYLSKEIGKKVIFIKNGGDDPLNQAREQWNDGTNVLAIAPNEVIAYSRNHITIEELKKAGVKIHLIPSSELSRGRGGPRCMTMPIWREDVK